MKAVQVFYSKSDLGRCTEVCCEVYQTAARLLLAGEPDKVNLDEEVCCDQVVQDLIGSFGYFF